MTQSNNPAEQPHHPDPQALPAELPNDELTLHIATAQNQAFDTVVAESGQPSLAGYFANRSPKAAIHQGVRMGEAGEQARHTYLTDIGHSAVAEVVPDVGITAAITTPEEVTVPILATKVERDSAARELAFQQELSTLGLTVSGIFTTLQNSEYVHDETETAGSANFNTGLIRMYDPETGCITELYQHTVDDERGDSIPGDTTLRRYCPIESGRLLVSCDSQDLETGLQKVLPRRGKGRQLVRDLAVTMPPDDGRQPDFTDFYEPKQTSVSLDDTQFADAGIKKLTAGSRISERDPAIITEWITMLNRSVPIPPKQRMSLYVYSPLPVPVAVYPLTNYREVDHNRVFRNFISRHAAAYRQLQQAPKTNASNS